LQLVYFHILNYTFYTFLNSDGLTKRWGIYIVVSQDLFLQQEKKLFAFVETRIAGLKFYIHFAAKEPVITQCDHCPPGTSCDRTTGACIKGRVFSILSAYKRFEFFTSFNGYGIGVLLASVHMTFASLNP
jgi:hypothetical protein